MSRLLAPNVTLPSMSIRSAWTVSVALVQSATPDRQGATLERASANVSTRWRPSAAGAPEPEPFRSTYGAAIVAWPAFCVAPISPDVIWML